MSVRTLLFLTFLGYLLLSMLFGYDLIIIPDADPISIYPVFFFTWAAYLSSAINDKYIVKRTFNFLYFGLTSFYFLVVISRIDLPISENFLGWFLVIVIFFLLESGKISERVKPTLSSSQTEEALKQNGVKVNQIKSSTTISNDNIHISGAIVGTLKNTTKQNNGILPQEYAREVQIASSSISTKKERLIQTRFNSTADEYGIRIIRDAKGNVVKTENFITTQSAEIMSNEDIEAIKINHPITVTNDIVPQRSPSIIMTNKLSQEELLQRELDAYCKKWKEKDEIGLAYERYVGYLYEMQGYNVSFEGALQTLNDKGRDLICKKKNKVIVIQCKYWSNEKLIRENAINQLYGTSNVYFKELYPGASLSLFEEMVIAEQFEMILYTKTKLSETARSHANELMVKYVEDFKVEDYPMIKCNVNANGKLFHLPTDPYYDMVKIIHKNECYAKTINEAISKGFAHALDR